MVAAGLSLRKIKGSMKPEVVAASNPLLMKRYTGIRDNGFLLSKPYLERIVKLIEQINHTYRKR